MSRWWRAHDEAVDDPKLQQLSDGLFKAWFNICCITSQNGGTLPAIDAIAFKLRTTPAKATKIIVDLKLAGLVDDDGEGNAAPHNWDARQFKSDVTDPTAPDRMKRYRKNRKSVTPNTVTHTVTVTPTRAETEQSTEKKDGASAPPIDPDADLFRRGKEVLGADAGSLIARLKKAKGGSIPHTRAAIEQASTKDNPREYIGRVMNGPARVMTAEGLPFPEGQL
jgi:hypothetical protein